MTDVIVVGDADTDLFVEVPRLPTWDEGVLATRVLERPGGKGANTAAALSRLGVNTGFFGCVGDDRYGQIARAALEAQGVDTSHLFTIPGGNTYWCIILLDPSGEKAIVVVKTDTIYPSPALIRDHIAYFRSARHVHAIGLEPEKVVDALRIARQAGCTTSVDLDSARAGLSASEALIKMATFVLVNEQGACSLLGKDHWFSGLGHLHSMGPEVIVVTRGRRGAVGFDGHNLVHVPSFSVAVKDTTGAGDCFSAAFIAGHLRGWGLERTLLFASAAAALSTREIGGQTALPDEEEVSLLLA